MYPRENYADGRLDMLSIFVFGIGLLVWCGMGRDVGFRHRFKSTKSVFDQGYRFYVNLG